MEEHYQTRGAHQPSCRVPVELVIDDIVIVLVQLKVEIRVHKVSAQI